MTQTVTFGLILHPQSKVTLGSLLYGYIRINPAVGIQWRHAKAARRLFSIPGGHCAVHAVCLNVLPCCQSLEAKTAMVFFYMKVSQVPETI